jgi:hypothetical protein
MGMVDIVVVVAWIGRGNRGNWVSVMRKVNVAFVVFRVSVCTSRAHNLLDYRVAAHMVERGTIMYSIL